MNDPARAPVRHLPASLGPYRVEALLGAGGMGEVYAAWDEALERRVAIKLVRAGAGGAAARARFRREARAAAALAHPAVVRVYELLTLDDGEAIVMELVEGATLAERLRGGVLGFEAALGVAVQVAEALAAAHARGIVHRDLKTENVMVTPAGEAKVVDFGLARQEADAATSTHVMAGTWRAMSPEQARAQPVDQRSDLFSFGTLLYETFTGISPFLGAAPLETLTNVCTLRPAPLAERGLPQELSALVERLLDKDPAQRPQAAAAAAVLRALQAARTGAATPPVPVALDDLPTQPPIAADAPTPPLLKAAARRTPRRRPWAAVLAALALGSAAGAWWWARSVREPPLAVVVPAVALEGTPSAAATTLQAALRMALLRGLLGLRGLAPVAPDLVDPVPGSPLDVARAVAADELITARLACGADTCRVRLARLAGRDGRLLWTAEFETPAHRPALLPEVALGYLRRAYPEQELRGGLPPLEVPHDDFAEFLALQRGFDSGGREGAPLHAIDTRLQALRLRAPRFLEAGLFEADLLRRRFLDSRDRALLDQAADVLGHLRALAPGDPRLPAARFELALTGEDRGAAEQALDELERLQPGDPDVEMQRARLHVREPDGAARAVALARSAARRRPSWHNLFRAAQVERRVGGRSGTDAARAHLENLLERHPASYAGKSLLAETELLEGSPQRAAELYGELAAHTPRVTVLANLALAHVLLGRLDAAEAALRRAAQSEPDNLFVALNLADVVLQRGRTDEAEAAYRHVLALAERDPARSNWQVLSVEAQALAHLGRHSQAVERLQRMIVVAGDNPQAALDAAVAYAVVGDTASAVASAARARRGGIDARWLRLTWFDALRGVSEFRALLHDGAGAVP